MVPGRAKHRFDGDAAGSWDIYVISSQGGNPTRMTTNGGDAFRPSWSRDGKWIYYCSTRTGQPEVWKVPAAGGRQTQITKSGGGVAFESVDGVDLYYTKDEGGLWKMPVRGGQETKVLNSVLESNFAPTKHGIYFQDGSPAFQTAPNLKFLDFKTGEIRTLAMLSGPVGDEFSVSPDEQWLLFYRADRQRGELMLIDNFR
jgi:dipeptidyl aminopeptidase/acylaminoacyl peptidase